MVKEIPNWRSVRLLLFDCRLFHYRDLSLFTSMNSIMTIFVLYDTNLLC